MARSPYANIVDRLVKTTAEPENDRGCWVATSGCRCRFGYTRIDVWVPGLCRNVKMSSHILLWLAFETKLTKVDDLYLAYVEFRCSGLELDHLCKNPPCRNPDHLEPVTRKENEERKKLPHDDFVGRRRTQHLT